MLDLVEHVRAFLLRNAPVSGGILAAISGGADSIALLHILSRLRHSSERPFHLAAAHANHQLRGKESDGDQQFVASIAAGLDIPFVSARLAVREAASKSADSVEMAARRLRHNFLVRAASEHGCLHIALAHHANDQAELVLLRLLRGGGSEGLGGMSPESPSPVDGNFTLLRPFLGIDRNELRSWLASEGLPFREDSSNADTEMLRNRIRADLLPHLETHYNPSVVRVLCRTADLLGAEADFIRAEAVRWLEASDLGQFGTLHPALQRAVVREQLWRLGHAPDFDLIEKLRTGVDRLQSAAGGSLFLRDQSGKIERKQKQPQSPNLSLGISLHGPKGSFRIAGKTFRWSVRTRPLPFGKEGVEQFDLRKIGRRLRIRQWEPGDRYRPLGFPRSAKLQDIFVSRKIPRERRGELLIFEDSRKNVVWVEGLPPSDDFKVDSQTQRVFVLRCVREKVLR